MIECLPDHRGRDACPECGESHTPYQHLPEKTLTADDIDSLVRREQINEVIPVFQLHAKDKEGYHTTIVPELVVRDGNEIRVLWNDPSDVNSEWITAFHISHSETPRVDMRALAGDLHINAMANESVAGFEVVKTSVARTVEKETEERRRKASRDKAKAGTQQRDTAAGD
jgi:hypothetical protein